MIAASAVLVVVAFVTLIIGIFQTGLGLIWVSIASSVLAAIFLLLGVVRGRPPKAAPAAAGAGAGWSESPIEAEATSSAWAPTPMPGPSLPLDEAEDEEAFPEIEPVAPPPRRPAARPAPSRATAARATAARPAARAASATRATASKSAARPARAAAAAGQVVVIPDRDKFHKTGCRYSKGAGAMRMTKSEARRSGYKPCGVCKP